MRVLDIVEFTTVDGPGFRNSVYLAGCQHHCPGCHNQQSWDLLGGTEMSVEALADTLISLGLDVTLSGGDPMYQAEEVAQLACLLKKAGLNVWVYTGYTFEEVRDSDKMNKVLDYTDVLVDGRFMMSERNTRLQFRGSTNQRLIDVAASRREGKVVEWTSNF